MNNIYIPFIITLLSGLSTCLGYLFIYTKTKDINKYLGICLSFSGSIMLFISIFELIPEGYFYILNKYGLFTSITALIGAIILGLLLNILLSKKVDKKEDNLYRVGIMSMIALMIHNLPEGIITYISCKINMDLGIKLSLAILMHNIPEGIAIAVPIYYATKNKLKAFTFCLISGLAEFIGALFTYLFLSKYISNTLISVVLLFASGIMINLSINEIYVEARKYPKKYLYIGIIIALGIIILTEIIGKI